jgi:serine/threonine protein kinase
VNPTRFADYTLLRRIATGGTAEIFLARRHGVDGFVRHLAIKRILPHLVDDPDFVQLLLDEARLAAHLHHGHIIEIHQVGLAGGHEAYIAMEYLPGIDLGRLAKRARRRPRQVLVVAADPNLQRHLTQTVSEAGFNPLTASSAHEAMQRAGEGPLDLVLCDGALLGPTRDPWLESIQSRHPELMRTVIVGPATGRGHGACALHVHDAEPDRLITVLRACLQPVLPVELALQVVRAVVDALEYAHTARDFDGRPLEVVHRDVNPSNVLVSVGGAVKLVDFGIARARTSLRPERKGNLVGTYAYMSPEQAMGGNADMRSDLFCVGTLMYELLAGQHPFSGDSEFATLRAVREDDPPALDSVVPGLPEGLSAAVAKALQKNPGKRYATAGLLLRDLEAVMRADGLDLNPKRLAGFLRVVYSTAELDAFGVNDTGYGVGEHTEPEHALPPAEPPVAPPAPAPAPAAARPAPRALPDENRPTWPPQPRPPTVPSTRIPWLMWMALLATSGLAIAGWLQYARAVGAF